MLISEAFDLYRSAEIKAAGGSRKTDEHYFYAGRHVVKYFGNILVENITPDGVRNFLDYLSTWQRPDTARGYIICLRRVIKYLRRKDYKVMDPEDIKIPKKEKREVLFLEKWEVDEFIEEISRKRRGYAEINRLRNIAMAKLLFTSGVRVSELCRLNRNSIKNHQFVAIGKSKNPRPCYINDDVQASIEAYLALRADNNPAMFISNQNGLRVTTAGVRRVFSRVCKISDFDGVHPHTMRHSFATYMLEQKVDLSYIGKMLGHTNISTTEIYTHFKDKRLQELHQAVMGA